jgi:multicomponent Na+:H+ antiporter subunit F
MTVLNNWIFYSSAFFLALACVIAIVSAFRFSSILEKLVVLEVLTNLLLACIALWALFNRQFRFIDICLTLALMMFLGVVAYYQFLQDKDDF